MASTFGNAEKAVTATIIQTGNKTVDRFPFQVETKDGFDDAYATFALIAGAYLLELNETRIYMEILGFHEGNESYMRLLLNGVEEINNCGWGGEIFNLQETDRGLEFSIPNEFLASISLIGSKIREIEGRLGMPPPYFPPFPQRTTRPQNQEFRGQPIIEETDMMIPFDEPYRPGNTPSILGAVFHAIARKYREKVCNDEDRIGERTLIADEEALPLEAYSALYMNRAQYKMVRDGERAARRIERGE